MLKGLRTKTIILAGLMVSVGAFGLTQAYNIHQLKAEIVESQVEQVMKVADSSS